MSISRFIKLYSLALLLLLLLGLASFQLTKQHLRKDLEDELKLSGNTLINQLNKQMELAFANIISDLTFLSGDKHLQKLHLPTKKTNHLNMLEQLWTDFATHRKHYDQIRFLGRNGAEIVRINYNKGHPAPVRQQELQSKRNRYYFTDVIGLAPGSIYASPLDLNIENKQIELPLKPVIRFGMPVSDAQGGTIGVLLLNYLAEDLLKEFSLSTSGFHGQSLLLNHEGYQLISPDSSQAWSFMFPDSPQTSLRTQHPTIWQALKTQSRGQKLTNEGLFTFAQINPTDEATGADCLSCLTVLLFTPQAQIESILNRQVRPILPSFLFSLLLIAIILGWLLWQWDRRRIQQQEIVALNDQIVFERDLFVSGPGIIVKLRNEIGLPVEYISPNIQDLLGYTPDAFLKEGMTYSNIIDPAYLPQYISETQTADQTLGHAFKRSPYRVIDHLGKHKWVQELCRATCDESGNVSHYYAHIGDINALKKAEHKLTLSHDYIQKVVDTLPDPTVVIELRNHQVQLANQSARSLYIGGSEINPEMTCYRLFHKRDTPCTGLSELCPIQDILITGKPVSVRHKHFDHNGKPLYIDVRATPLFDSTGQHVEQIVESHHDVTETVQVERQLQQMATTDQLTQVYNRHKFDSELINQLEWAQTTNNTLGLIMFDLDHFKQVNDSHGHDVGDEVLKNTVTLVRRIIRKSDTLARWGGEEFMIITPLTDAFELKAISESLRSQIEKLEHKAASRVTASFGGTILKSNDTFTTLIKRVDEALYQSKQSGRNRCTIIE